VIELRLTSGEASLAVRRFHIQEAMNEPFVADIVVGSPRPDIDPATIVGHAAAVHFATGIGGARAWTGVCSRFEQVRAVAPGRGESTYELQIVPVFWLLSQRRNMRIFQHKTAPEIAMAILSEWRIEASARLDASAYPKLEYRVQYGESDLDFVSRVLEEAGIAYFFVDDPARGSTLVLSDAPEKAEPRGAIHYEDDPTRALDRERITAARLVQDVRPGAYTVRDFDFRRPGYPVVGAARPAPVPEGNFEQYVFQPGVSLVETTTPSTTPHADDRGVARHDLAAAAVAAQRRLDSARAARRRVHYETNLGSLAPGVVFSMRGHPHDLIDDSPLLVVEQRFEGTPAEGWTTSGSAVFASEPHRPAQKTEKPRVHGVQSAIVVGPPGQEIHTDEFGRVRVQFAWDREGRFDDGSSCWMRVSHGSAGGGFGMIVMPRVGQEVLVGFLEGDPDQPIVVGRVFNATSPVPYKLPEQKRMTGLKGSSSPAGTSGFNEIRFDDATGGEHLHVRAERDLSKLVQNDESEHTGGHREVTVKKNLTKTTEGHESELTHGLRTLGVIKSMCKMVGGDESEGTAGDRRMQVGGKLSVDVMKGSDERVVGGKTTLVMGDRKAAILGEETTGAAKTITLQAGADDRAFTAEVVLEKDKITLRTKSGAMVVLDGDDITLGTVSGNISILGTNVNVGATGTLTLTGDTVFAQASGKMTLFGDPIDLNPK
jgi:type VI secretion system secreted protein VgrG